MNKKYYTNLINRIYKVLCIYETDQEGYPKYVNTLCFELSGNREYAEIEQARFKLLALLANNSEQSEVRKTVFECINLVNRILKTEE